MGDEFRPAQSAFLRTTAKTSPASTPLSQIKKEISQLRQEGDFSDDEMRDFSSKCNLTRDMSDAEAAQKLGCVKRLMEDSFDEDGVEEPDSI